MSKKSSLLGLTLGLLISTSLGASSAAYAGAAQIDQYPHFARWLNSVRSVPLFEPIEQALKVRMGAAQSTTWRNPLAAQSGATSSITGSIARDTYTFHAVPRANGDVYKVLLEVEAIGRGAVEPEMVFHVKLLASTDPTTLLAAHERLAQSVLAQLRPEWRLNASGARTVATQVERMGPAVRITLNHLPENELRAAFRVLADELDTLVQEGVHAAR